MARYTNFFMTGAPKEEVHQGLVSALEGCGLDLVYQDPVYIVAKEKPGQVSFAQLTTVELLLNPPTDRKSTRLNSSHPSRSRMPSSA